MCSIRSVDQRANERSRDARLEADVFRLPGYFAFWTAETVSAFGSQITTLALQVLVIATLNGTATDVGLVNASRWLPYVMFGLVVGAMVDRWRRQPLLVTTDLARACCLGALPVLWLLGWLSVPVLMGFVTIFGVLTLFNDAATQSFLPRLVPAASLLAANARLDQGAAVAQTTGPALAGALVAVLGAPLAVVIDALTYLLSAIGTARISVSEPKPASGDRTRNLRQEIGAGLSWMYRHPTLAPLAISTHGWFVFHSMATTAFVPFLLLQLELTPFQLGLALAIAGGAGLVGTLCSVRLGLRWGAGRAVIACRAAMPVAWACVALAPDDVSPFVVFAWLGLGQALYGLAMGAENANEMGYWQTLTPDALQGRVNATRRSINRGMIVIGAPLGGFLADAIGYRLTFWIAIVGFVIVAAYLALSPFRDARHVEVAHAEPGQP